MILLLGAIAGAAGATATRPHAQAWRCITVRPGETLWGMAGTVGGEDRRQVVQRIVDHNGLQGRVPLAGQPIWMPNEGEVGTLLAAEPASCPAVRG